MPERADCMRRLASFCRLILFDRRGTGASDPVDLAALPTWETWAEDLGAVLDAVGSRRAALFAAVDSGPITIPPGSLASEKAGRGGSGRLFPGVWLASKKVATLKPRMTGVLVSVSPTLDLSPRRNACTLPSASRASLRVARRGAKTA
jgi:hypothetical protein